MTIGDRVRIKFHHGYELWTPTESGTFKRSDGTVTGTIETLDKGKVYVRLDNHNIAEALANGLEVIT